ncbi:CRISPR-associated helicase/endonuclease Cas3 [Ktedonobacter sp. SOSP1-85]|uniref:CRISPR-associated helicase Cas3' n=1 Tax=Ktedonobacter sp. SOSP1-85 TaxID=2778367 RepID=UPI001916BC55|nr:CRISPR-associated helicase Cas3' [Ktedonobacter sp. SOSP1-85]GHO77467.1 CRISPR-associated helicase/endonuclease Cas3 [Ktedonobacter sp. SOSP1-85]
MMLELYPYQQEILQAMANGENVILVVPTGGGKTLAASLPFLQNLAFKHGLLPTKALYAVPTRSLATQFLKLCKDWLEELDPDLVAELKERYAYFGRDLFSIQTGESPEDPQFESVLTACTIDQLLASALGVPYSVDSSRANINVGAICSSYLILDEPHLYPVAEDGRSYKGGFTTCVELLRQLKDTTRFVFMSATMSNPLVEQLAQMFGARVITVNEQELALLNRERERIFERCLEPMSSEHILASHKRCSLVVCNTVQRAQETFLKLDEAIQQAGLDIELRLLHSRFTDDDRKNQGDELSQLLGKEQWHGDLYQGERSVIVVATQVVEVGLDISVETLHTEIAPANSLVQRAGRCARFERQHGRVVVYPLPLDEEGQTLSSLPYPAILCDHTWQALAQFEGRPLGFREEQDLVDQVHTVGDLELLKSYEEHRNDLREAITESLRTHERGNVAALIRDITQVQLLIHNDPDEAIKSEPWRWQTFGIHPGQLLGKHWQRLREKQAEVGLEWLCKQAVPEKTEKKEEEEEKDSRQPATYTWDPISTPELIPTALIIAMPEQLVTYDQTLGLVFLDGRLKLPEVWEKRLAEQHYQSMLCERRTTGNKGEPTRIQSYEQHIEGLADAYHYVIYHELAYIMHRLERLMDLEAGTIDHAIQIAIATHDLGKLDQKWQLWARNWQRLLLEKTHWGAHYQEPAKNTFLAKTDYDWRSKEQKKWQREVPGKRPHHACESVMLGRSLILDSLAVNRVDHPNLPVARAICTAIAHHHTPKAHTYGTTHIHPAARTAIEKAIHAVRRDQTWHYNLEKLKFVLEQGGDLNPENVRDKGICTQPNVMADDARQLETWLVFVIVRALRLADQRADRYAPLKP